MDKLIIHGGQQLSGIIPISGAKNAALPILCTGLLTSDDVVLTNIPHLKDVQAMLDLLRHMGVTTQQDGNRVVLNGQKVNRFDAPHDLVKSMRAAILVLCPLVARFGEAQVALPGGCAIGSRPIEQHIKGLRALGAEVEIKGGYIYAHAKRLKGTHITTDMITVTGTENLLMAAVLADGETIIKNAAREPEVTDLANILIKMGAKIEGVGTNRLVIHGVKSLHGATHHVIPDRIETGTFLCATALTGGNVLLTNTSHSILNIAIDKIREMGAKVTCKKDTIRIQVDKRLKGVSFRTSEYPGFPTDMQAQFMAVNCMASGSSQIVETIFENRFMHVQELKRLGAQIQVRGNTAFVTGVERLTGTSVNATDLRASASLVIAGLAAQGETIVNNIYHLDRGYDHMEVKLASVGANIKRIQEI